MPTDLDSPGLTRKPPVGILIIEDNPDHWTIMQRALAQCMPDVNTFWSADTSSAFSYLDDCMNKGRPLPKLIILDLYIPDRKQGWELLSRLKSHPHFHRMPVLILSYSADIEDITESYQLGVASYIVKPVDYADWLTCFQKIKSYWWDTVVLPTTYR